MPGARVVEVANDETRLAGEALVVGGRHAGVAEEGRSLRAGQIARVPHVLPVRAAIPVIVVRAVARVADVVADTLVHHEHGVVEGRLQVAEPALGPVPEDDPRSRSTRPTARCRCSTRART